MKDRKTGLDPVHIFKVADPALQTLLLVIFFLSVDPTGPRGRPFFFDLLGVQVISSIVNFFVKFPKKKLAERIVFLVLLGGYAFVYNYVKTHVPDSGFASIDMEVWARHGKNDFYLLLSGIAIALYYLTICFREARSIYKKKRSRRR